MEEPDSRIKPLKCWPWYVTLGFGLLMAVSAGAFSLLGDPEARFWRKVLNEHRHDTEMQREGEEDQPMIFVGGGSSCSFSIHPDVLEEVTGMPAANVGGSAAMGYRYLIWLATRDAKKGDVVILHLEPDILRGSEQESSTLAAKVDVSNWFRERRSGAFADSLFADPVRDLLPALRPGAKLIGTMAAKKASGRPQYQYSIADLQGSGVLTTKVSAPNADVEPYGPMAHWLDEEAIKDLEALTKFAEKSGVRIFYTLPWECFQEGAVEKQRGEHAKYLSKMALSIPVLTDEKMGAVSHNPWFLDTGFHMTLDGGRIRSRMLGEALKEELKKSP